MVCFEIDLKKKNKETYDKFSNNNYIRTLKF